MDYYLLQFQFKTPSSSLDLLVEKATSEAISTAYETWLRTQAAANRTRTFFALLGRTPGPELRRMTIDFDSIMYLAAKPDRIVWDGDALLPTEKPGGREGRKLRVKPAK